MNRGEDNTPFASIDDACRRCIDNCFPDYTADRLTTARATFYSGAAALLSLLEEASRKDPPGEAYVNALAETRVRIEAFFAGELTSAIEHHNRRN